jgi:enoyl-CoA hydratase/carnithine racemase
MPNDNRSDLDTANASTDLMLSRVEGAIGWMSFNNPARHNAVSLDMWKKAREILDAFAQDPAVRVVVITGEGGKSFVSGADISKFETERASATAVEDYDVATEGVYETVLGYPKPTVAMIRGFCIGGGLNLAVCCDFRICNERARFAVPAARLGLGYGYARVRRLMMVVGAVRAKEMLMTARQVSADEAVAMDLVNRIVVDEEIEAHVREFAAVIADNAPLTVAAVKQAVGEVLKDPAERDLARCARLVAACFASKDYQEGRKAFAEKRKPVFGGN